MDSWLHENEQSNQDITSIQNAYIMLIQNDLLLRCNILNFSLLVVYFLFIEWWTIQNMVWIHNFTERKQSYTSIDLRELQFSI